MEENYKETIMRKRLTEGHLLSLIKIKTPIPKEYQFDGGGSYSDFDPYEFIIKITQESIESNTPIKASRYLREDDFHKLYHGIETVEDYLKVKIAFLEKTHGETSRGELGMVSDNLVSGFKNRRIRRKIKRSIDEYFLGGETKKSIESSRRMYEEFCNDTPIRKGHLINLWTMENIVGSVKVGVGVLQLAAAGIALNSENQSLLSALPALELVRYYHYTFCKEYCKKLTEGTNAMRKFYDTREPVSETLDRLNKK